MRQFILILFLFLEIGGTFCQERYYFDIPSKGQPKYQIDLNNAKRYNTDTINFKIESLVLLKSKKSWHINNLSILKIVADKIYAKDNKSNLLIFDINGNPINKVDLNKTDKNFKLEYFDYYNDTLYLLDNRSLLLLKFSSKGDFISKSTLIFNFEDFQIKDEGIYFISKHWEDKRKKSIRITLFDFSLNLLEQYFISDTNSNSELRPKFVAKEDHKVLFLSTECNQVYSLEKDGVYIYMEVNGGDFISNYSNFNGFHLIKEGNLVKDMSYNIITTYYFPKENLKSGICIKDYSPVDLSILWDESIIYKNSYICLTNLMEDRRIENVLEMKWLKDHLYIKDDLLGIMKQVDEENKFIISRYKVIENP